MPVSAPLPRFRFPKPTPAGGGEPRRPLEPRPAPCGILEGPPQGPARAARLLAPSLESGLRPGVVGRGHGVSAPTSGRRARGSYRRGTLGASGLPALTPRATPPPAPGPRVLGLARRAHATQSGPRPPRVKAAPAADDGKRVLASPCPLKGGPHRFLPPAVSLDRLPLSLLLVFCKMRLPPRVITGVFKITRER